MDNNNLKRIVVNSDVMKIFITSIFIMSIWIMAKVYFQMNAYTQSWFVEQTYPWMAISKNLHQTLMRPWVFITHSFIDTSFGTMFTNFIWLYFFGIIIENQKGRNSVLPLFIFTTLVTGIAVFVLININATYFVSNFYYGMRACVIAITIAAVMMQPKFKVFPAINAGIDLWIVGIISILLNIVSIINFDMVNILAILLAATIGFFYNNILSNFFINLQTWCNNDNNIFASKKKDAKILNMPKTRKYK
jgi:membrane associated rhomboid family serine protease